MLVGKRNLNQERFSELCNAITYDRYKNIVTNQTDTVVLNLLFKDDVEWLDFEFNAFSRFLFQQRDKLADQSLNSLKFIHFLGKAKPWLHRKQPEHYPFNRLYLDNWIKNYNEVAGSLNVG